MFYFFFKNSSLSIYGSIKMLFIFYINVNHTHDMSILIFKYLYHRTSSNW